MQKISQLKQVATYITAKGSITSIEAYDVYDITRLAAYIYVLRHKYGWKIDNEWIYTRKHWWSFFKTRFVKYVLKGK